MSRNPSERVCPSVLHHNWPPRLRTWNLPIAMNRRRWKEKLFWMLRSSTWGIRMRFVGRQWPWTRMWLHVTVITPRIPILMIVASCCVWYCIVLLNGEEMYVIVSKIEDWLRWKSENLYIWHNQTTSKSATLYIQVIFQRHFLQLSRQLHLYIWHNQNIACKSSTFDFYKYIQFHSKWVSTFVVWNVLFKKYYWRNIFDLSKIEDRICFEFIWHKYHINSKIYDLFYTKW